jgi:two-component system, sensor histidine kinase and response regulator
MDPGPSPSAARATAPGVAPPATDPAPTAAPGGAEETLRVLVVDDEAGMRSGIARVLARWSLRLPELCERALRLEVAAADTGEAALEQIAARPPDLLLLDQRLPGASGLEVLSRLPALAPQVLTIMVTADATLATAVAATKRGAFDFLAKPFTPDELRAVVLKAARQALLQRQARHHAAEKRRIRFEFLSVLAHELKAPLAAVEGYLLAMQGAALGPDITRYAPAIERSLARLDGMRRLVADLLDMTRIESGERRRELCPLDVVELARGALEAVRADAEAHQLSLSLKADGPLIVRADRVELELVLGNLLTNAVKYNRPGGRVELSLEAGLDPDRLTVRVRDTGIGMTREEVGRLFQEFVRIKNERTRLIPGTGLGLSTVQKVARLYGGEARVTSEPDAGTTVEVELRVERADEP